MSDIHTELEIITEFPSPLKRKLKKFGVGDWIFYKENIWIVSEGFTMVTLKGVVYHINDSNEDDRAILLKARVEVEPVDYAEVMVPDLLNEKNT